MTHTYTFFLFLFHFYTILSLFLTFIISITSKVEFEKSSTYECGVYLFQHTFYNLDVQFAQIAIMFRLFYKQVIYLYPLITSFSLLFKIVASNISIKISLSFYNNIKTIKKVVEEWRGEIC